MSIRAVLRITSAVAALATAATVGALAAPRSSSAGADALPLGAVFVPVTPWRLFDTRTGDGLTSGSTEPVAGDVAFEVDTAGAGSAPDAIPVDAVAVVMNVTYVDASGPGYVTLYPAGATRPTASNLNKVGPGPVPNLVTVKLGPGGAVAVYNQGSPTHLLADVAGYYVAAGAGARGPAGVQGSAGARGPQGVGPGRLPHADTVVTPTPANEGGFGLSATVGTDGLPMISTQSPTRTLVVVHCTDARCTTSTSTELDATPWSGMFSSIAIGADGLPIIAHANHLNHELRVTHCADEACTTATTTVVVGSGLTEPSPSIATGRDGLPVIAFWDSTNDRVKVTHCTTATCSASATSTIDPGTAGGRFTSLAIGSDGFPILAYQVPGVGLNVAHCGDPACTSAAVSTVDARPSGGSESSIVIGDDGLAVVSSIGGGPLALRTAHCDDVACATATVATIDTGVTVVQSAITIGADGFPVIAYLGTPNDVRVAHCNDAQCASVTRTVVESATFAGEAVLTLGTDGLPVVVYNDMTDSAIHVLHCANVFCTPFASRR